MLSDAPLSCAPQVCGGNPGAIRNCVTEARAQRSWDAGACMRLQALVVFLVFFAALLVRMLGLKRSPAMRPRLLRFAACDALRESAAERVHAGLQPSSRATAAATPTQYRAVLAALAAAPHGALQCATLAAMSGVGGPAVLEALQQQNLIVRRSFHTLARDIPLAAFGARRCDVYMLPSAAHAAVARDMARAGELQPSHAWWQLRRRA